MTRKWGQELVELSENQLQAVRYQLTYVIVKGYNVVRL